MDVWLQYNLRKPVALIDVSPGWKWRCCFAKKTEETDRIDELNIFVLPISR